MSARDIEDMTREEALEYLANFELLKSAFDVLDAWDMCYVDDKQSAAYFRLKRAVAGHPWVEDKSH